MCELVEWLLMAFQMSNKPDFASRIFNEFTKTSQGLNGLRCDIPCEQRVDTQDCKIQSTFFRFVKNLQKPRREFLK